MNDILGRTINTGDLIAYTTTIGRSTNLRLYKVMETTGIKLKVRALEASYSSPSTGKSTRVPGVPDIFATTRSPNWHIWVEMSEEEKEKVRNKTSIITHGERALIIRHDTEPLVKQLNDVFDEVI